MPLRNFGQHADTASTVWNTVVDCVNSLNQFLEPASGLYVFVMTKPARFVSSWVGGGWPVASRMVPVCIMHARMEYGSLWIWRYCAKHTQSVVCTVCILYSEWLIPCVRVRLCYVRILRKYCRQSAELAWVYGITVTEGALHQKDGDGLNSQQYVHRDQVIRRGNSEGNFKVRQTTSSSSSRSFYRSFE